MCDCSCYIQCHYVYCIYTCTYIMSHNYVHIVSNRILLEIAYLFFSGSVSVICVEYCRRMSFTVCFLGSLTNYMYSTS